MVCRVSVLKNNYTFINFNRNRQKNQPVPALPEIKLLFTFQPTLAWVEEFYPSPILPCWHVTSFFFCNKLKLRWERNVWRSPATTTTIRSKKEKVEVHRKFSTFFFLLDTWSEKKTTLTFLMIRPTLEVLLVHSFLNKSPLPRVCYPKEICSIFFGADSLVIIIIGGPMKLRTFVGPKGPFTDGQRWKLVLVQSLLPHILGSQSYFHCVHWGCYSKGPLAALAAAATATREEEEAAEVVVETVGCVRPLLPT